MEFGADAPGEIGLPRATEFSDLRYQVRRCLRKFGEAKRKWKTIPLRMVQRDELEKLIDRWAESAVARFRARGWPMVVDPQVTLVEPNKAVALASSGYPGQVVCVDGVASALWIAESTSDTVIGLYCLLADTRYYNLAYLNVALALASFSGSGFQSILLGGSEIESLFRFKRITSRDTASTVVLRRVRDLVRGQ